MFRNDNTIGLIGSNRYMKMYITPRINCNIMRNPIDINSLSRGQNLPIAWGHQRRHTGLPVLVPTFSWFVFCPCLFPTATICCGVPTGLHNLPWRPLDRQQLYFRICPILRLTVRMPQHLAAGGVIHPQANPAAFCPCLTLWMDREKVGFRLGYAALAHRGPTALRDRSGGSR